MKQLKQINTDIDKSEQIESGADIDSKSIDNQEQNNIKKVFEQQVLLSKALRKILIAYNKTAKISYSNV